MMKLAESYMISRVEGEQGRFAYAPHFDVIFVGGTDRGVVRYDVRHQQSQLIETVFGRGKLLFQLTYSKVQLLYTALQVVAQFRIAKFNKITNIISILISLAPYLIHLLLKLTPPDFTIQQFLDGDRNSLPVGRRLHLFRMFSDPLDLQHHTALLFCKNTKSALILMGRGALVSRCHPN